MLEVGKVFLFGVCGDFLAFVTDALGLLGAFLLCFRFYVRVWCFSRFFFFPP